MKTALAMWGGLCICNWIHYLHVHSQPLVNDAIMLTVPLFTEEWIRSFFPFWSKLIKIQDCIPVEYIQPASVANTRSQY